MECKIIKYDPKNPTLVGINMEAPCEVEIPFILSDGYDMDHLPEALEKGTIEFKITNRNPFVEVGYIPNITVTLLIIH